MRLPDIALAATPAPPAEGAAVVTESLHVPSTEPTAPRPDASRRGAGTRTEHALAEVLAEWLHLPDVSPSSHIFHDLGAGSLSPGSAPASASAPTRRTERAMIPHWPSRRAEPSAPR